MTKDEQIADLQQRLVHTHRARQAAEVERNILRVIRQALRDLVEKDLITHADGTEETCLACKIYEPANMAECALAKL